MGRKVAARAIARHVVIKARMSDRHAGVRGPVEQVKPKARLWREAMRLAGGDWRRIEVVSPTELVVKNRPVR